MARKRGGARVFDLVAALEELAPTRYAAAWDNVGLLVGDPDAPLSRALLAIDYTPEVAAEAVRLQADAVVAYHPPVFKAQKTLCAGSPAYDAAAAGIALYSPHTALDAAPGGTNDVLADAVGMKQRSALSPYVPAESHHKLVVFVPADALDKVSSALFAAGAGHIGNYSACSFRAPGIGTFFGEAGAQPALGEAGRLEEVAEIRLEMVLPIASLGAAVAALRASHPYEEPAFDFVRLAPVPATVGMGRIGRVAISRGRLIDKLKAALGVDTVMVGGPFSGRVTRVAVCAGAGGELLPEAMAQGAEVFVTGELRHHDALAAARGGVTVVCTRHSVSERIALAPLATKLGQRLPAVRIKLSRADRDAFAFR